MEENNQNKGKALGGWWREGVTLFAEVSSWIAGPIIVALVLGKKLDGHFGTKPWMFLGLTGISFFISCYGIYRIVMKYIKNMEVINSNTTEKKD